MPRLIQDSDRLPYALYRAEQVRELDRTAIEDQGIPGIELMERAGRAAYDLLRQRWPKARDVTVACGIGNNGGDGYVVARYAQTEGLGVRVLQPFVDVHVLLDDSRLGDLLLLENVGETFILSLEFLVNRFLHGQVVVQEVPLIADARKTGCQLVHTVPG